MIPTQATTPLSTIKTSMMMDRTATMPLGETESRTELPDLKISKPLKIPTGVSSNTKQHVLLVRDCSSSMSGSKVDEMNLATTGLIQELASEKNKDGFLVSLIDFSTSSKRSAYAVSAIGLTTPRAIASGGTNFDSALLKTIETIESLQNEPNTDGWRYLRPQVLFLSDGQSRVSEKNILNLQEIADVTTIAYGSDALEATLSKISTDGQCHVIGTSGAELRKFLADVGQTLSQTLSNAR